MPKPHIFEIIKKNLASRGVSQSDLARKTRVKPPQISNWLSGKHSMSLDNLERIAHAAGLPAWALIKPEAEDVVLISQHLDKIHDLESEIRQLKAANSALDAENETRKFLHKNREIKTPHAAMKPANPGEPINNYQKSNLIERIVSKLPAANDVQLENVMLALGLLDTSEFMKRISKINNPSESQG